jgi:RHS repeat-associated protein
VNGVTTYYPSASYQEEDGKITKYYSFGGQKVAQRHSSGGSSTLSWLIPDHLGSTNVTANADGRGSCTPVPRGGERGTLQSEMRYAPFGETRYTNGVTPSDYRYTGQLSQPELGLYYYVARWYDPQLGRFIQADTVVPNPGDAKAFDRYSYVINNPINLNDPLGHCYNYSTPEAAAKCDAYWEAYNESISQNFISQGASKYGVNLIGFSTAQKVDVYSALKTMDNLLPVNIAQFTYGKSYTQKYTSADYGGTAYKNGNISFRINNYETSYQLRYHEITHIINYLTDNFLENELNSSPVYNENGDFVMGGSPNNYQRNSQGYLPSVFDPIGRYVNPQQHPGDFPCGSNEFCIDGNNAAEEVADLVASYIADAFSSNAYGYARKAWVEHVFILLIQSQQHSTTHDR